MYLGVEIESFLVHLRGVKVLYSIASLLVVNNLHFSLCSLKCHYYEPGDIEDACLCVSS